MKKVQPIVQILTGTLLIILIVNDFVPLLLEYLMGTEGIKLPIEFSPGGWKVKYWMIDHQPAFSLYQIFFMGTGFLLVFSAIFKFQPSKLNWAVVAGLVLSGLFVLLFPHTHYITEQTPKPFMIAQIAAGLILIPAAINKQNIKQVAKVAILIATVLCALLLALCVLKSIVTLKFALWPILGIIILLLLNKKISQ